MEPTVQTDSPINYNAEPPASVIACRPSDVFIDHPLPVPDACSRGQSTTVVDSGQACRPALASTLSAAATACAYGSVPTPLLMTTAITTTAVTNTTTTVFTRGQSAALLTASNTAPVFAKPVLNCASANNMCLPVIDTVVDVSDSDSPQVTSQIRSHQASSTEPVVVIKNVQMPKTYSGKSSWKLYKKKYFERTAEINSWTTNKEKLQRLILVLDGAALEAVSDIDKSHDRAYEQAWDALARRFGQLDEEKVQMRRFDQRTQLPGESVEFEQSLKILYNEAWPCATTSQRDSDLNRRFEDELARNQMMQYLRLHARDDDFKTMVDKARNFETLVPPKKSVKLVTNGDTPSVNEVQDKNTQHILDNIETIVEVLSKQKFRAPQVSETSQTQTG